MSNREKYDAAFLEVFEIGQDQLTSSLEYQSITAWDSVGHMAIAAARGDKRHMPNRVPGDDALIFKRGGQLILSDLVNFQERRIIFLTIGHRQSPV